MKTSAALTLSSLAWLGGCNLSHGENNTSGSNWLRCHTLPDCKASAAVACSAQGYCTDQNGERIAASSSMEIEQGSAGCASGVDAILAKGPASLAARQSCGSFELDSSDSALEQGLHCFDLAREVGRVVEFSVNRCQFDCSAVTTYVATDEGKLYEVFELEDADANNHEVTLKECERISLNAGSIGFACENEAKLYQCIEPLSRQVPGSSLTTPFKLSDAPNPDAAPTVTLHLYASNQSFDEPLTSFFVRIDEKRVVLGDFPVESQHNWYSFDIEVPKGTRRLDVNGESGASLMRDIEITAERWLVIDYWYASGDEQGRHFTLTESDVPVAFD